MNQGKANIKSPHQAYQIRAMKSSTWNPNENDFGCEDSESYF